MTLKALRKLSGNCSVQLESSVLNADLSSAFSSPPLVLWILRFLLVSLSQLSFFLTNDTAEEQIMPCLRSVLLPLNEAGITRDLFFSVLVRASLGSLETWPHLGFSYAVTCLARSPESS